MMRALPWLLVVVLAAAGLWWFLSPSDGTGSLLDAGALEDPADADAPTLAGRAASGTSPRDEASADVTRIDGPRLRIAGVVTGSGVPLEGASVTASSLFPTCLHATLDRGLHTSTRPPRTAPCGEPLGTVVSDAEGGFALDLARRSRHRLTVSAPGHAPQVFLVDTPVRADPAPLHVDLAPGFRVRGIVVDEAGAPRAGLTVRLQRAEDRAFATGPFLAQAVTDAAGRCDLGTHAAGGHRVVVQGDTGVRHVQPAPVPMLGGFRVQVPRGATVAGTLRSAAGDPVGGARVLFQAFVGDRATTIEGEATTAADGAFRVTGIVGTVQDVLVQPAGGVLRSARMGSVRHAVGRLAPGSVHTQDLVLTTGHTLRGRVVAGETEAAVEGIHVALVHAGRHVSLAVQTVGSDGAFAFHGVPTDAYTLRAVDPADPYRAGYAPDTAWAATPGRAFDGTGEPIELTLRRFGRVEGSYQGPSDGAVQGYVTVRRLQAWTGGGRLGRFLFPHVEPAAGAVVTLTGLLWNRPQASSEPFEVVAGQTVRPVVVASQDGRRVRGTIRDEAGAPVVGAYVSIGRPPSLDDLMHGMGARPAADTPWTGVRSDARGVYELPWPTPDEAEDAAAWFLRVAHPSFAYTTVEGPGVPGEGEALEVDVVLGAGRTVRGRVLTPAGEPAVGARVRVVQGAVHLATTDAAGGFVIPQLAEGPWSVHVEQDGARFPAGKNGLHEVASAEVEPTLTLVPVPVLAGRVVDADGRPVAGVHVRARVPPDGETERPDGALESVPAYRRDRYRARLARYGEDVVARGGADAQGVFHLECERAGTFELVVESGWRSKQGILVTVSKPVRTGRTDIELVARLGARVTGRVVDAEGRPVEDAHVIGAWPEPAGFSMGMSHDRFRPMAATDVDGRFVLTGLDDGPLGLVVAARDHLPLFEKRVLAGADVELVIEPGEVIEGTVLTPEGRPYVGLELKLVKRADGGSEPEDPRERYRRMLEEQRSSLRAQVGSAILHSHLHGRHNVRTDAQGRFVVAGLERARYEIVLERNMVGVTDPIFPKTIVASGAAPIVVKTRGALRVAGRVVDEQGKPITYWFDRFKSYPHVGCHQQDGKKQWNGTTAWDFAEPDGTFEIGGLSPGPVRIVVEAGDDYEEATLDTTAGTTGLRIVLKKRAEEPK